MGRFDFLKATAGLEEHLRRGEKKRENPEEARPGESNAAFLARQKQELTPPKGLIRHLQQHHPDKNLSELSREEAEKLARGSGWKGEGSRGGHVIGHTRSGKAKYGVPRTKLSDFGPRSHMGAPAKYKPVSSSNPTEAAALERGEKPKKKRSGFGVACQECGHKFRTSGKHAEVSCPKCHGVDIDMDYKAVVDGGRYAFLKARRPAAGGDVLSRQEEGQLTKAHVVGRACPACLYFAKGVEGLRDWVGKVGFNEALSHVAKHVTHGNMERAKKVVGKLKGMANRAGTLAPEHAYGKHVAKAEVCTKCRKALLPGSYECIHCGHDHAPVMVKGKKPKLGSGGRFAALKEKLSRRKGKKKIHDPAALAAYIGRKKYGAKRFAELGAKG